MTFDKVFGNWGWIWNSLDPQRQSALSVWGRRVLQDGNAGPGSVARSSRQLTEPSLLLLLLLPLSQCDSMLALRLNGCCSAGVGESHTNQQVKGGQMPPHSSLQALQEVCEQQVSAGWERWITWVRVQEGHLRILPSERNFQQLFLMVFLLQAEATSDKITSCSETLVHPRHAWTAYCNNAIYSCTRWSATTLRPQARRLTDRAPWPLTSDGQTSHNGQRWRVTTRRDPRKNSAALSPTLHVLSKCGLNKLLDVTVSSRALLEIELGGNRYADSSLTDHLLDRLTLDDVLYYLRWLRWLQWVDEKNMSWHHRRMVNQNGEIWPVVSF